ncbi:hypothetical protein JW752_04905 [Candidatus Peregrinibacteria bacterium]|nr:hypothetical protein [Candidatus Peregrinibacteria bacterium]
MMPAENDKPLTDGDVDILERSMEELEAMSMDERREFYQKFSALVLFRYLISKNLLIEGAKKEDIAMLKGCTLETGAGISAIYDVLGSRWQVFLERLEEYRVIIMKKEAEVEKIQEKLDKLDESSEERKLMERRMKKLENEIDALLKDPKLYVMDLKKSAKVVNRNDLFYN